MTDVRYKFTYQVNPIILVGGLAENMPGQTLPMMNLLAQFDVNPGASGVSGEIWSPYGNTTLDDAVGAFNILPGGTLVNQQIGKYPFANQSVAANAIIFEPLTLSLIMDAPMRSSHTSGGDAWTIKNMIFSTLKASLDLHNSRGGRYTVFTPAYMYENMLMIAMTDNSRGNNTLPQNAWRFDFEKPLVALQDLRGAFNLLMSKLASAVPVNPEKGVGQPKYGYIGSITNPTISPAGQTLQLDNFPIATNPADNVFGGIP